MNLPVLVLKAHATGYKDISLNTGYRIVGRSAETGIKSSFVSRKHVELFVDCSTCKVRYCGKHKSQVRIDAVPVGPEWVECPAGARLEILSTPESFWYTLGQYKAVPSAATSGASSARGMSNGDSVAAVHLGGQSIEVDALYHCSMCMDLYVDPTELDCDGRHLFCHQCIVNFLREVDCSNKCPFCSTKISGKRRQDILTKNSPNQKKRGRSGSKKYQSQAVRLVEETIKWMIEQRMCEYGDESEWRTRSGLEPLPPRPTVKAPGGGGADKAAATTGGSRGAPVSSSGIKGIGCSSGDSSEVINLLSDSDDD